MYRRRIIPEYGPPEIFQWESFSPPKLNKDDILVKTEFIGINYADILARRGFYKWAGKPPICPGFEVSGEIIDKGDEVDLPIGSKVFGVSHFEGYSEAIVLQKQRTWLIPKTMTSQEAAAFPAVYLTAYHSLHEIMRVREGESILIHAVAGGLGTAALQIAKASGLTVFGTASTDEKLKFAQGFGLDHGINYSKKDYEKEIMLLTDRKGVKFVLDTIGGYDFRKSYNILAPMGLVITVGAHRLMPNEDLSLQNIGKWFSKGIDFVKTGIFHPLDLMFNNKGMAGVQILVLWKEQELLSKEIKSLIELQAKNKIKIFVDKVFPLAETAKAHKYIESRQSKGKVLLQA